MRLPPALTSGGCAAAAVLLLTGCGGGDAEESSAAGGSSSSAAPSAAQTSAAEESAVDPQEFCRQTLDAGNDLDATFDAAGTDTSQVPRLLAAAVERFDAITPPAAAADDWNALTGGLRELSDTASSLDLSDPTAFSTFSQKLNELSGPLETAQTNVGGYIRTECGIDPGTGGTVAPSS